MWAPGTLIEKIALDSTATTKQWPIGTKATVSGELPNPWAWANGFDITANIHGDSPGVTCLVARLWRPLDDNDPTGITTVDALVRSLSGVGERV